MSDSVLAVGLDVGGTKIAGGIVALPSGEILSKEIIMTLPQRGGEAVLSDALALARRLVEEAEGKGTSVLGIGIGVAELIDPNGNVTSGQTIAWRGVPVRERFSEIAPAIVESDVRAAALGEAMFGAGKPFRVFAYITVGTGISYALVQDGRVYSGARGNAILLSSGPLSTTCTECGAELHQVLEEFASGPALVARYNQRSTQKAARAQEVTEAANRNDPVAIQVVQSAGEALGNSVGFLINVLDPEAVIVGGGLGLTGGLYWNSFVASARKHIWSDTTRDLPILPALLGTHAGLIGAAATMLRAEPVAFSFSQPAVLRTVERLASGSRFEFDEMKRQPMSKTILDLLKKGVVLGDGGYLLELERRGYVDSGSGREKVGTGRGSGQFTPEVAIENPDALAELHREFLNAGSQVLQALTFFATREKLTRAGYGQETEKINGAAVKIARTVAGDHALVAGSVSRTQLFESEGPSAAGHVRELFVEQIALLLDAGVDFLILETFFRMDEMLIALKCARGKGVPVMATLSFRPLTTRNSDGHSPAECARILAGEGADMVGANCEQEPGRMLPILRAMRQATSAVIAAQPAAFRTTDETASFTRMPQFPDALETIQVARQEFIDFAARAKAEGIGYVGGCCGCNAAYIRAMARGLAAPVAELRVGEAVTSGTP